MGAGESLDLSLRPAVTIGGTTVNVERLLGEGGFGKVLLATDAYGRKYVIKWMHAQGDELLAQAREELRLADILRHPNVIRFVGHAERPFARGQGLEVGLLMEYCPGGTLFDVVSSRRGSPLPEKAVLGMFIPVVRAVEYLHSLDPPVAHRDIKLENVLIAEDGSYRLCDFGSTSKHRGPTADKRDRLDQEDIIQRFTTPVYRAPEMIDLYTGDALDERVDIWALGCFLYMLLFHTHPFATAGNLGILSLKYRMPPDRTYSAELKEVITRCLVAHPADRPTATTLLRYLEALASGLSALPPLTPSGAGSTASSGTAPTSTTTHATSVSAPASTRASPPLSQPLPAAPAKAPVSLVPPPSSGPASAALQRRLASRGAGGPPTGPITTTAAPVTTLTPATAAPVPAPAFSPHFPPTAIHAPVAAPAPSFTPTPGPGFSASPVPHAAFTSSTPAQGPAVGNLLGGFDDPWDTDPFASHNPLPPVPAPVAQRQGSTSSSTVPPSPFATSPFPPFAAPFPAPSPAPVDFDPFATSAGKIMAPTNAVTPTPPTAMPGYGMSPAAFAGPAGLSASYGHAQPMPPPRYNPATNVAQFHSFPGFR